MKINVKKLDSEYIAQTYARNNLLLEKGKGCSVYGEDKEYLDFTSGIGVNSLGFCDEKWVEAVCSQAKALQHTSNLYYTQPGAELAEKLCKQTGMKKVFFGNSGAEANECAIKAARKYSFDRYGGDRYKIISLKGGFHGRTMATLSATGQDNFHKYFDPFLSGFSYAAPNDFDEFLSLADNGVCAVMTEMIQGEGGVNVLDKGYVKAVADYCEKHDILLICDEVQTGMGRTGKMLCCEHFGIKPDIVTLAKGLGGGLPIGAALMNEKCEKTLSAGDHGSTFGMNPIVCAGASVVVDSLTPEFLEQVTEKGEYLAEKMAELPFVESVSGIGLMRGATLKGIEAKTVVAKAMEKGLLCLTAKDKLRLLPPLVVTKAEIDRAIDILSEIK